MPLEICEHCKYRKRVREERKDYTYQNKELQTAIVNRMADEAKLADRESIWEYI